MVMWSVAGIHGHLNLIPFLFDNCDIKRLCSWYAGDDFRSLLTKITEDTNSDTFSFENDFDAVGHENTWMKRLKSNYTRNNTYRVSYTATKCKKEIVLISWQPGHTN